MPIHVAITRKIRPGAEEEFQALLHDFFQSSFNNNGVLGAHMLVPPPGSDSREFGILRTFRNEEDRDTFYRSSMFKAWEERARSLTEGEPQHRQLHGLEAWFRSSVPPPRWKMAIVTLMGVYPVSLLIGLTLAPHLKTLPLFLHSLIVSALIVTCLTWLVMPSLTKLLNGWLKK